MYIQCKYMYVIVIVRLVCDMVQTQHESRKHEVPEGECCVCTISHTKRTITITYQSIIIIIKVHRAQWH